MSKNPVHVGPASGGPADGKTLRAKASRLTVPVIIPNDTTGFGQAIYTWDESKKAWIYG